MYELEVCSDETTEAQPSPSERTDSEYIIWHNARTTYVDEKFASDRPKVIVPTTLYLPSVFKGDKWLVSRSCFETTRKGTNFNYVSFVLTSFFAGMLKWSSKLVSCRSDTRFWEYVKHLIQIMSRFTKFLDLCTAGETNKKQTDTTGCLFLHFLLHFSEIAGRKFSG